MMCDVCYVCRGERTLFAGGARVMRYVLEFCVLLCILGTVWRVSTAGHPVLGHAERDVYKHEV